MIDVCLQEHVHRLFFKKIERPRPEGKFGKVEMSRQPQLWNNGTNAHSMVGTIA